MGCFPSHGAREGVLEGVGSTALAHVYPEGWPAPGVKRGGALEGSAFGGPSKDVWRLLCAHKTIMTPTTSCSVLDPLATVEACLGTHLVKWVRCC